MTLRPHCLRCGSPNVSRDDDQVNSAAAVACMNCGNRQYMGTDYVGFEMRDDGRKPRRVIDITRTLLLGRILDLMIAKAKDPAQPPGTMWCRRYLDRIDARRRARREERSQS